VASAGIPIVLAPEIKAPGRPAIPVEVERLIATMADGPSNRGEFSCR